MDRVEKYFNLLHGPEKYTKLRCAELAGYSPKTKTPAIESNPKFKTLTEEYEARKKDLKRDTSERINEAMAQYNASSQALIRMLSGIAHSDVEEAKAKISAAKQIVDITQDKNKDKKEIGIPGLEAVLDKIFMDN